MATEALVSTSKYVTNILIGAAVLGFIFFLIPAASLPQDVALAFSWFVQQLVNFDFIVPTLTILIIFGLFLTTEITLLAIKLVNFAYKTLTRKKD